MEFSPRYVAIYLLSVGISNVAVAGLDSACMPVINASEARAAKAMWALFFRNVLPYTCLLYTSPSPRD